MRIYLVFMTLVLLVLALVFPLVSLGLIANPESAGGADALSSGIKDVQAELKEWYARTLDDDDLGRRIEKIAGLVDRLDARQELASWDRRRIAAGLAALGAAASGLACLVGVVLWFVTWRGIYSPLRQLAKDLAGMNSERDLPFLLPRGLRELRDLHGAFNGLAARLADYRQRIQTAERQTMSRFIVHEVRNSLTPISLGLRSLRSGQSEGPAVRAVGLMEEALVNLEGLLEQLKSLYADATVSLQNLDVREVLATLPSARDARVSINLPAGMAASADPVLLGLAVDNLLRNALQALDASGIPGHVEVRSPSDGELALAKAAHAGQAGPAAADGKDHELLFIALADNGPGIDESARMRIFDEYFTTKLKGMGLGLAFARKVLQRQAGGLCLLPADPGIQGACFVFWLKKASQGNPA